VHVNLPYRIVSYRITKGSMVMDQEEAHASHKRLIIFIYHAT